MNPYNPYNANPQTTDATQVNPSPFQQVLGKIATGKMINLQALIQSNPGLVGTFQKMQQSNPAGVFIDVAKRHGLTDEQAKNIWTDYDKQMAGVLQNFMK